MGNKRYLKTTLAGLHTFLLKKNKKFKFLALIVCLFTAIILYIVIAALTPHGTATSKCQSIINESHRNFQSISNSNDLEKVLKSSFR